MIHGIQQAYYTQAQNPSDESTLIAIAEKIGINVTLFKETLNSHEIESTFENHRDLAKRLGSRGFPSLVLLHKNEAHFLVAGYGEVSPILEAIASILRT